MNAVGSHNNRKLLLRDADDEKEEDREEETSGTLWGHASLPQSVYGNNPAATGKRKSTNNAVWNVVKYLTEHTAHSVVVDTKYIIVQNYVQNYILQNYAQNSLTR